MKMKMIVSVLMMMAILAGCTGKNESENSTPAPALSDNKVYKVTFLEFGSTTCIPCKQMKSVLEAVEQNYSDQVKVVFHNIKTDEGAAASETYGIKLIPTQVLLDKNGQEFFRHEGFIPLEGLVVEFKKMGVEVER
ncbi:thioredoxin family protein [bacterium]|nr:thioredoxin family protein [bacterium]